MNTASLTIVVDRANGHPACRRLRDPGARPFYSECRA